MDTKKLLSLAQTTIIGISVLTSTTAFAISFSLDFDTDALGNALDPEIIDDSSQPDYPFDVGSFWSPIGIDISVIPNSTGNTLGLFDSNCGPDFGTTCSGGDPDLATGPSFGTTPQSNVLIIEENPGDGNPSDSGTGGQITFTLDSINAAILDGIGILDDSVGSITVNFTDATQETIPFNVAADNDILFVTGFAAKEVSSIELTSDGSFAVTELLFSDFTAVPFEFESAMGILLVAGFLGFKHLRQQKKV